MPRKRSDVDWFEEYAREHLKKVRRSGREIAADCPVCNKPGRFYLNAETGDFICFKCEFKGRGMVGLVAEVEGVTHVQARRLIFKRSVSMKCPREEEGLGGLTSRLVALREDQPGKLAGSTTEGLPPEFVPVWDEKMRRWMMPEYLLERGFTRRTAKRFGLGFCNSGRYRARVVVPICCPAGRSFTARDTTGELSPKYLNPKGVDHGRLLMGWEFVGTDFLVLVEGPFDVAKFVQHGIPTVGLLGKVLHLDQLALLTRLPETLKVVLMLDPEERIAPLDAATRLRVRFDQVFVGRLPTGVDPGASAPEQAWAAVEAARPFNGARLARLEALLPELG